MGATADLLARFYHVTEFIKGNALYLVFGRHLQVQES
jgi:hypothetical protein